LILNTTASEPYGIYWLSAPPAAGPVRGALVVISVPSQYQALVLERHWVRAGTDLLKGVGAVPGDVVCVSDTRIAINHKEVAPVLKVDSKGRALPHITGCTAVPAGSFLPLSTYIPNSFDGRYMGAQPNSLIKGIAHPLWTF
jgi:conjugative transfer signal peptidase TraF